MRPTLEELLANAQTQAGRFTIEVPESWMQGRSVFGGLQSVAALCAMRTLIPTLPLRALQTTFIAPVSKGKLVVEAKVLRAGKNVTQVEARIVDKDAVLALVVGVFGSPVVSTATLTPKPADPVPPSEASFDFPYIEGITPEFTQNFKVRWLRGSLPFSGGVTPDHVLELSMPEETKATENHVVAIADFIPPLALSLLSAPAPGSSLTWMLEMLVETVERFPLSGWHIHGALVSARDGYTSQDVTISAPDGTPVARSRQSMLVFG